MKYQRFALALLISSIVPAFAASAATAVMVQFGSFETLAEAQKRLSDVRAAHGAAIGSLPLTVREVKLPPDNLTVYRTQAGPLETRSAAQSICSKLANSGDECYVVETAMSGVVPAALAAATAPALPAISAAPATISPPVTTFASPANAGPALAPLTVAAPVAAAPVITATPSPEMQAALNRAAEMQDMPSAAIVPQPLYVAPAEKPSFWSRMNPFSDTPAPQSNLKPDFQPAPQMMAAPASTMLAAPEVTAEPIMAASAINLTPQVEQPYQSLPLLPPPPPLTARDEAFLRQNMAMPTPQPEVIAQPLPQPVAATPAPAPAVVPAPVAVAASTGSVQVEEAKRVPLTEATLPPITTVQAVPAVSLLPSSTLGQKTLWAQVGQFSDAQAALAFWERYRQQNPDFPVVRVRVTSSVMQQKHGNDRVWLRVGPFAREGFIRSLCRNVDYKDKVQCGIVTDVGAAGNASPGVGYLNGSRYKR